MTAKVDVQIGVSDQAEFAAFYTKFQAFQAEIASTPEEWKKVAASAAVARENYKDVANAARNSANALEDNVAAVSRLRIVSETTSRIWASMSHSTKAVAGNILEATSALLKWAGITSIIGGVLSGGAFFGLDRLANRVGAERTSALGVGSSPGRQRAADISYSRFVGEGFSSKIAAMQHDANQVSALKRLLPGMSAEQIASADPNDLIGPLLEAGRARARGTRKGQLFNDPELNPVFSHEQINTLASSGISETEIPEARANYAQNAPKFEYKSPRAWQDFERVLEQSERTIKSVFVDRLTGLTGPIKDLTKVFSDMVVKLIQSDAFSEMLKKINEGAEWLAKEVDSPEFQTEVTHLVDGVWKIVKTIGEFATGLVSFAKWLGFDVGGEGTTVAPAEIPAPSLGGGGMTGLRSSANRRANPWTDGEPSANRRRFGHPPGEVPQLPAATQEKQAAAMKVAMAAAEDQLAKEGVPEANRRFAAAALIGNAVGESDLDPTRVHDHGTGYGVYGARDPNGQYGRRHNMLKWLSENNFANDSLEGQIRQMAHSAMTDKAYAPTRRALMGATAASVAGATVTTRVNFEGPSVPRDNARLQGASRALRATEPSPPVKLTVRSTPGSNPVVSTSQTGNGALQ